KLDDAADLRDRCQLPGAQADSRPFAWAGCGRQFLRAVKRGARRIHQIETAECAAETDIRHRQVGVEPQRLIEGTRGFNPNVTVQVRDTLKVERLRLF